MQGAALDHLVIAARTLEAGVAWCEATLGVTPTTGGRHALMGTHNRVFTLATEAFPRAYFELIAIDPDAAPPGRARWFDLDDVALQATLERGPQLVAWVARVDDLDTALQALSALGIDAGRKLQASRMTPQGELRWRIAVRDDGARLADGGLPTLIEWGGAHPTDALRAVGVTLASITLRPPAAPGLQAALRTLELERAGVTSAPAAAANEATSATTGRPAISVILDTPRGRVPFTSPH